MSLEIENKATSSVDNKNENKTQIDVSKFINTNVNQELKGKKLDSHDESLKQNLNDLIQKLNLNELRADLINQNGEESVSLKDETWNVYCKLRSFYSFENEQLQWLAGVLYLTYEKMLVLNKLNHIHSIEQQSLLHKNRHKMARSSSNLGLKRKMTSDKLNANYEIIQLNENQQETMFNDPNNTDNNRFPYFPFQLMLHSVQIKDLKEFFSFKLKFLIQALNVDDDLLARFNRLQSHFNITCILYSKYKLIVNDFLTRKPHEDADHFKLAQRVGWLLFISIKCKYPHLRNDLINSYHLLICSVAYSYVSYFVESNSETKTDEHNDISDKEDKYHKVMQTIDYLCAKYEKNESETNISVQVKTVYEYHFRMHLEKLESFLDNSFSNSKHNKDEVLKHKLTMIYEKLNSSYELFLQKRTPTSQDENRTNCCLIDMAYSLEIDERLYLHSTDFIRNAEENGIGFDNVDSNKYRLILPECLSKFLAKQANKSENEEPSVEKFDIKPLAHMLESALGEHFIQHEKSNELNLISQFVKSLNHFYVKMIDVLLFNEQISFSSSTQEAQKQFQSFSNELLKNQISFHKALYVCCFEIMFNFSSVQSCSEFIPFRKFITSFQPNESQAQQEDAENKLKVKCEFPWSMKLFELDAFDLFKLIETFVKNTTNSTTSFNNLNETKANAKSANNSGENNQSSQTKRDECELILLDKQCVQHLNRIENELLESLVWHESSNIWNCLKSLKLNESYELIEQSNEQLTQLNMAFPLYDEVINNTFNTSSTSNANGDIILNLTPNPVASSQLQSIFSSSIKQPTITRVVGADSKNVITTTTQSNSTSQANKVTLVTVNKMSDRPSTRLINMNNSLCYFFRKFYNLANLRMRELIEKLDLINMVIHSIINNNEQNPTISSSTPHHINSTQVQLTPISSAFNEQQQALIRSIWNIFEFAMSQNDLIKNRHLDQLLMCCIYVTCRLCSLNIQFQDIIKSYRIKYGLFSSNSHANRSFVYRSVLLDSSSQKPRGTIIDFYNQIFIKKVQKYAAKLFNKLDVKLTPLNMTANIICPSPVPRTPNTLSYTLFSPRKISDSIFISPGKHLNHQNSASTSQYVQPLSNRNKLTFSFNDLNPAKSIDSINEMIKKNENKMRTSNKRLFSEISSSYNSIPTSSSLAMNQTNQSVLSTKSNSQTQTPLTTSSIVTNVKPNLKTINLNSRNQAPEDGETKIKISKITLTPTMANTNTKPTITHIQPSAIALNPLNKILSPKVTQISSPKLITMVVNGNSAVSHINQNQTHLQTPNENRNSTTRNVSILPLGSNFRAKLQNIHNERTTAKQ